MANNPKNYNDTSPAAPSGKLNVKWQAVAPDANPSVARDVSAYVEPCTATTPGLVPTPPNDATKFLDGTGVFSTPSGGGGGGNPSFVADGDDMTAWTVGTIGVLANQATTGQSPDQMFATFRVPNNANIFIDTALPSLAGYQVDFDVTADSGSLIDFMIGCTSTGAGPMIRHDGRGSSPGGLAIAASWQNPNVVTQFSYQATAATLTHYSLKIDEAGLNAAWYVNGVLRGKAAFVLTGTWIGFWGDAAGTGGNIASIRIWKP